MTLVRVEETDSGGFTVLNLQMVARVKCAGFDGRQQEHRASVYFSDGGMVELAGRYGLEISGPFALGALRV
jgi:hypothetical protein